MSWIFQGIVVFIVSTLVMSSVSGYVETPTIPDTVVAVSGNLEAVAANSLETEAQRNMFCEDPGRTLLSGWYTADARPIGSWTAAATQVNAVCTPRFVIGQVGDTIVILIPLALVFLIMAAVGLGTSVTGYGKVYRGYKAGRGATGGGM